MCSVAEAANVLVRFKAVEKKNYPSDIRRRIICSKRFSARLEISIRVHVELRGISTWNDLVFAQSLTRRGGAHPAASWHLMHLSVYAHQTEEASGGCLVSATYLLKPPVLQDRSESAFRGTAVLMLVL